MAAFVPTGKSDPKSGEAQSPVKSRRSSNYDRLKRLRQLKEKAKAGAQKNVERVTEGGATGTSITGEGRATFET